MEKCTKKRDVRAKLLFCVINLLLFDVLVAVAVVVAKAPYYEQDATERTLRRRGCGTD